MREYKEDKFNNWKQLDIYNDQLCPFLRNALLHMYYNNIGTNNPTEYKQKVDKIRSNLIEQFDELIGVFIPEKINLALIAVINNTSVILDNIVTKTKDQIALITSDARNRIDAQYTKNATINNICISHYIGGIYIDHTCSGSHKCPFRACKNKEHNIGDCFGISMPPSVRIMIRNSISYNKNKHKSSTPNPKPKFKDSNHRIFGEKRCIILGRGKAI